jgi:hypothetical protein
MRTGLWDITTSLYGHSRGEYKEREGSYSVITENFSSLGKDMDIRTLA